MNFDQQQIEDLIEAQHHYFEACQPEKAAKVVIQIMAPLFDIGRYPELVSILGRIIDEIESPDPRMLVYHARTLSALGQHEKAIAELEFIKAETWEDSELQAAILIDEANFLRRMGAIARADEIIGLYREAYNIYEEKLMRIDQNEETKRVFRENQASCLFNEGAIFQYFLEDPEEAMKRYQKALEIFEEVQSPDGIGDSYKQKAEIYALRQYREYNFNKALEFLDKALDIFQKNKLKNNQLQALYQLGRIQRSDAQKSIEVFKKYQQIARELGLIREEAVAKKNIIECEFHLFRNKIVFQPSLVSKQETKQVYFGMIESLKHAVRSLNYFIHDVWSRRVLANCYYLLGNLWIELKDEGEALSCFKESLNVCNETIFHNQIKGDVRRRLRATLRIMQIHFVRNEVKQAQALFTEYKRDFDLLKMFSPDQRQVSELIGQLEARD